MHESVDQHFVEGILRNNDEIAEHNREHFDESGLFTINLMSAPGAGKTSLLSATIPALSDRYRSLVVEGDMVGELDADRLRNNGITAHQITTGRSCHLDAAMVNRLLHHVSLPSNLDFLFIENVGNLVCPAEFPLGEHKRVVLLSVTEGADKPLKYPVIFRQCDAVIFTKCDLLPHVDFDLAKAMEYVHGINPEAQIFALSVKQSGGLTEWLQWLERQIAEYRSDRMSPDASREEHHVHITAG
jgi:hydrogenase nickel incorporation protein HypB